MKVMIVDDEPAALIVLSSMLSAYEDVEIVGSYTDPIDALEAIEPIRPDAVFLDIEMGQVNGLEIAELFFRQDILEIVFVTAYSQYAVEAFEINAIDYLLKPIQRKRLDKTIERLREKPHENDPGDENGKSEDRELIINSLGGFEVYNDQGDKINWRTQKTKELLAYLWVHNESLVNKSIIMEIIFPDKDLSSASTLLHTTVYQLRKSLENLGFSNGVIYSNESYRLKIPIKSDIEKLNNILGAEDLSQDDIREILSIYRGDFLEEEWYPWAMGIQDGLRNLVFNALEGYVVEQMEGNNLTSLLGDCLSLMCKIAPLNDTTAKMTMEYLGRQGKRCELKTFFHDYRDKLWEDMGLKPMENTTKVYESYVLGNKL